MPTRLPFLSLERMRRTFPYQGCVSDMCRIFFYDNVCECIRAICNNLEKRIALDDDADADRFYLNPSRPHTVLFLLVVAREYHVDR